MLQDDLPQNTLEICMNFYLFVTQEFHASKNSIHADVTDRQNINTLRITSNKTTQLDEYWSLAETVLNLALGSLAVQVVTSV